MVSSGPAQFGLMKVIFASVGLKYFFLLYIVLKKSTLKTVNLETFIKVCKVWIPRIR